MRVAIIPARGGSKRIPRKNIKVFAGKPIIAHTITIATESQLFDRIVVSTDDREIAETALEYGAHVPFVRPSRLADDFTDTSAVIAHALDWFESNAWKVDSVCCMYATAPFIRQGDLECGLKAVESGHWTYAFAAAEFAAPIFRSFFVNPGGGVEMFFPDQFTARSQDLPVALHDAGQFYWGQPEAWLGRVPVFGGSSLPIVVPRWCAVDIDSEEDWQYAELLWKVR